MTRAQKITAINSLVDQIGFALEDIHSLNLDIIGWEADIQELEKSLEDD